MRPDLERAWLDVVAGCEAALPTDAQKLIESCAAWPDFLHAPAYTAIWVDGPSHDAPDQRAHDADLDACLADLGYTSVRFRYDELDRWLGISKANPSVFGPRPLTCRASGGQPDRGGGSIPSRISRSDWRPAVPGEAGESSSLPAAR